MRDDNWAAEWAPPDDKRYAAQEKQIRALHNRVMRLEEKMEESSEAETAEYRDIDTLHDMILTLRAQLYDTDNRVEELEAEVFPSKTYKSGSGGWFSW